MTPHDYWAERGRLSQALRDVRWERRAVSDIFRHTRDPQMIRAGCEWLTQIYVRDIALCKQIRALDVRYQLES